MKFKGLPEGREKAKVTRRNRKSTGKNRGNHNSDSLKGSLEGTSGRRVNDYGCKLPIRMSTPVIRTPITITKMQPDSKITIKNDLKYLLADKPKQVFWEKRLEGLKATKSDPEFPENVELPKNMRPVGPNIGADTALRSVVTALFRRREPIIGQLANQMVLKKHPCALLDVEQPLVGPVIITDDEIKRQEERVNNIRREVAIAIKDYENSLP